MRDVLRVPRSVVVRVQTDARGDVRRWRPVTFGGRLLRVGSREELEGAGE